MGVHYDNIAITRAKFTNSFRTVFPSCCERDEFVLNPGIEVEALLWVGVVR